MKTLVGKFLVEEVATGYTNRRATAWRSTWFLHRSSMESARGWEVFDCGELRGPFATEWLAIAAAHEAGLARARSIQNDVNLPEVRWHEPLSDKPLWP
jgi:hypothetical protein